MGLAPRYPADPGLESILVWVGQSMKHLRDKEHDYANQFPDGVAIVLLVILAGMAIFY